jgi:hypothetical protein
MLKSWEESRLEPLSPQLHAIVMSLLENSEELAIEVTQLIKARVADYALIEDKQISVELKQPIAENMRLCYKALLDAQPLASVTVESATEFTRRRVHQGISLAALLRAYQIGVRGFWENLVRAVGENPELQRELLVKLSLYLFYHFDVVAQAIARTYDDEQFRHVRWRDRLRHELYRLIIARSDDVEMFRMYAESLTLDATAPHCAIVFAVNVRSPKLEDVAEQTLVSIGRTLGVSKERFLWATHHDHLVMWLPLPHRADAVDLDQQVAVKAKSIIEQNSSVRSAGIGLSGSGPRAWRISMEQAFKALELGSRHTSGQSIHRFSDYLLDDAVLTIENAPRLFASMIEKLTSEAHLLETLLAYFEHGQRRKSVAIALSIHPNTVDNRLERIEQLLGGSFNNLDWLARVYIAARLQVQQKPLIQAVGTFP